MNDSSPIWDIFIISLEENIVFVTLFETFFGSDILVLFTDFQCEGTKRCDNIVVRSQRRKTNTQRYSDDATTSKLQRLLINYQCWIENVVATLKSRHQICNTSERRYCDVKFTTLRQRCLNVGFEIHFTAYHGCYNGNLKYNVVTAKSKP